MSWTENETISDKAKDFSPHICNSPKMNIQSNSAEQNEKGIDFSYYYEKAKLILSKSEDINKNLFQAQKLDQNNDNFQNSQQTSDSIGHHLLIHCFLVNMAVTVLEVMGNSISKS